MNEAAALEVVVIIIITTTSKGAVQVKVEEVQIKPQITINTTIIPIKIMPIMTIKTKEATTAFHPGETAEVVATIVAAAGETVEAAVAVDAADPR